MRIMYPRSVTACENINTRLSEWLNVHFWYTKLFQTVEQRNMFASCSFLGSIFAQNVMTMKYGRHRDDGRLATPLTCDCRSHGWRNRRPRVRGSFIHSSFIHNPFINTHDDRTHHTQWKACRTQQTRMIKNVNTLVTTYTCNEVCIIQFSEFRNELNEV